MQRKWIIIGILSIIGALASVATGYFLLSRLIVSPTINNLPNTNTNSSGINTTGLVQTIEDSNRTHIVLAGDIMLSRSIGLLNKKNNYHTPLNNTGYNPINHIDSCKESRCIIFANLESPFSFNDLDNGNGGMLFRANTGNISFLNGLRRKNDLILTLANNHINNAGGAGIITTTKLLEEHNIYHVGAGSSKEDANRILVYTGNGIHFCIAGYSYEGNGGRYGGLPLYRNKVDLTGMLADLSTMKKQLRCDIKIMMLHRGSEYHMNPSKTQITQAHTLIDKGLDILYGAHSHVPGKIEVYSGKYIFYSLGNAMFDQDRGMRSVHKGMDTIYDQELKKNTVPTYITIFPELVIGKENTGYSIELKQIHTARLVKGIYSPLDQPTEKNLLDKITGQE